MTQNTRKTTLTSAILAVALAAMMLTAPAAASGDVQLQTIDIEDVDDDATLTGYYEVDEDGYADEYDRDDEGLGHVDVIAHEIRDDDGSVDIEVEVSINDEVRSENVTLDEGDNKTLTFEELEVSFPCFQCF